jgi:hypothetical protein
MALGSAIAREARRVGEDYLPLDQRVLREHPTPALPRKRERERASVVVIAST